MNIINSGDMRGKLVITNPPLGTIHTLNWSKDVRNNVNAINSQYYALTEKTSGVIETYLDKITYIANTVNTVLEHHANYYALTYATGKYDKEYFHDERKQLQLTGLTVNTFLQILEMDLKRASKNK